MTGQEPCPRNGKAPSYSVMGKTGCATCRLTADMKQLRHAVPPVGQCASSCRGGAPQFQGSSALTVRYKKGRDRSRPSHRCSKISYSSRQILTAGRHTARPQSPAPSFFHTHDQFRGMGAPPSVPWGKRAPVALCREPDEAAASSSHGSRAFSTWA